MKQNHYLNVILTIIAVALSIIILQNMGIISKAQAHTQTQFIPVNPDGSINVILKHSEEAMNVNIQEVGGMFVKKSIPIKPEGNVIDVNINEVGGYHIYGSIPVETR
jgi:hypothetical protein